METFSVKNWDEFQHYKDRNPPWIKLYNHLLDDYEFSSLPDCTKAHLVCIWMLASRTSNKIPMDADWIARKIGANSPVDIDCLVSSGFLVENQPLRSPEQVASKVHQKKGTPAITEKRERRDREEAKDKKNTRAKALDFSAWPKQPCDSALADYKKLRQSKRAPLTQTVVNRMAKAITELDQHGIDVDQALGVACERGWQGFKSEWVINHLEGDNGQSRQVSNQPNSDSLDWDSTDWYEHPS